MTRTSWASSRKVPETPRHGSGSATASVPTWSGIERAYHQELVAQRPNQVSSWDISKLLGPQKWTYYYLYVVIDIYSRRVVGWLLAGRESAELAQRLLSDHPQGACRPRPTHHPRRPRHLDGVQAGGAAVWPTLG